MTTHYCAYDGCSRLTRSSDDYALYWLLLIWRGSTYSFCSPLCAENWLALHYGERERRRTA